MHVKLADDVTGEMLVSGHARPHSAAGFSSRIRASAVPGREPHRHIAVGLKWKCKFSRAGLLITRTNKT